MLENFRANVLKTVSWRHLTGKMPFTKALLRRNTANILGFSGRVFSTNTHACPMGVRLLVGFLLSCWNQSITWRQNSHLNVGYIDDSYLQGKDVKECLLNISATQTLFTSLGFVINVEKSSLILSQQIKFLGLVLDLVAMSIILTEDKRDKLKALWKALQH